MPGKQHKENSKLEAEAAMVSQVDYSTKKKSAMCPSNTPIPIRLWFLQGN